MKTIYIIGAGAVGKTLAVSLKNDNKNPVLLRGTVDNISTGVERIEVLMEGTPDLVADVEVSSLSNFPHLDGLVVLTNKSYGNSALAIALKEKTGNSPVILLQNGLGIEQPFIDNSFPELYRCVLFVTSQNLSANKVRYKPVAVSPIGKIVSTTSHPESVVAEIDCRNFRFRAEANIQPVIWRKAIINSVFNSICPLLGVDNGVFYRNENVLAVGERIVDECLQVAMASGIILVKQDIMDGILHISRSSDKQFISTLQDIQNRRETEIQTLNLRFAEIANDLKMIDAIKETSLLGELVQLKSSLSRNS